MKFQVSRLRGCVFLAVTAQALLGCGYVMRWGDIDHHFTPASETAMVIGGVEGFTNFTFDLLFQQYDPKTQRLIPGGGRFVVHDSLYHRDLVASEVPAGYYILTRIVDERRTYNKTFITTPLPREEFNKFFNSVNDDADVSSVRTYRLRLKAGQIAYIGEYVRVTDKTGRWENRPDDLKKILNMMKNIKGETIFQPPRLTSKLDQ